MDTPPICGGNRFDEKASDVLLPDADSDLLLSFWLTAGYISFFVCSSDSSNRYNEVTRFWGTRSKSLIYQRVRFL